MATNKYEAQLKAAARSVATTTGVPEQLLNTALMALAEKESSFNPKALGTPLKDGVRAQGMFQYLPSSAKDRGIDPFDVMQSATAAAKDAAAAYKRGGVAEIAASHFAGAGGASRGPKTREYVRDFLTKMSAMGAPAHRFAPERTPRTKVAAGANPFAAGAPTAAPDADPTAAAALPDLPEADPSQNPFAAVAGMAPPAATQADPMAQYATPVPVAPRIARLDTNPFGGYDVKRDPTTLKWFESMIENADG